MDNRDRITLYTSQPDGIIEKLRDGEPHRARLEFIREKYGEAAQVFLNAYAWFTAQASKLLPRPAEAESAVWAFADLRFLERGVGSGILELEVPRNEAVFFSMRDWNRILNLRYLGSKPAEEAAFEDKLRRHGIAYEGDIFLKPFYPQLKSELLRSWERLFRHHEATARGEKPGIADLQAGLWEIRPQWVGDWFADQT